MPERLSRGQLATLALLTLLALVMRVWAVQHSVVEAPVRGDASSYFSYAVNMKTAGVYSRDMPAALGGHNIAPDATIAPGYPLFVAAFLEDSWQQRTMAGVYASIDRVLLAQALLGALLVPVLFLLGRGLLGTRPALAVAGLAAIAPHLVNVHIYLLTEALFTLLFWISLCLLVRAATTGARPMLALAAGAALAAATLTRPTVQYLPFLLAAFLILCNPAHWKRWAGFLAVFFALTTAWGLRNLAATGAFSDPTLLASTVQHGSYPDFMHAGIPESRGIPYRFDDEMRTGMPLRDILAVILDRARAAPGEYLHWYLIGKPLALLNWEILPIGASDARLLTGGDIYIYPTPATPYASNPLFIGTYLLVRLLYWPMLALAATASLAAWLPVGRRLFGETRDLVRLVALAWIYAIGIHMVGAPFPRYSIPFQPLAWLLAGALLTSGWRHWRSGRGNAGSPLPSAGSASD